MKAAFENIRHTSHMMTWSWRFIRDWRAGFILCSVFSVLQNAWMSVTSAYLIGQTTAHAATGDFTAMLGTIGLVAAIAAAGIITITITNYFTSQINIQGLAKLRKALFAKLNAMPTADAERLMSGDLSIRMSTDAERTAAFFSSMMTGDRSIFAIPVSILISSVICVVKLPVVGLLDILFMLVSIYVNLACIRREYTAHSKRMDVLSSLTQHMVDILSGSVVARVFRLVWQRQRQYETDSAAAYSHALRGAKYNAMRSSLSSAIQWGAIIFTLVAGGILVHLKVTDLGTVVFIVLMQSQINNDVLLMTNSYHQLQYATIGATRVKAILDQPDERMRDNLAEPEADATAAIDLQHVTVCYEEETPVLKELSLTVKNGERLAIVGGSGGGKTTLMKVILEFAKTDSGSVRLFGQPRERYSQAAVRELIAYVPQGCYLFDGTIRENIAWGNRNADNERIMSAALDAGLQELIDRLPDGIDTRVGEQGAQLSGGQRQRIAIARAMVKDAPLLLLDEATSALDGESEEAIQRSLEKLMRGRTAIVIAHRLSTVQNADRIIVLEQGQLVEAGQHEDLLARKGRYAELYRLQYDAMAT
jgi:ABC-type multidrug transport system fused ATPase/permease subunit